MGDSGQHPKRDVGQGSHEILAAYNFFFEHIGIRKGLLLLVFDRAFFGHFKLVYETSMMSVGKDVI